MDSSLFTSAIFWQKKCHFLSIIHQVLHYQLALPLPKVFSFIDFLLLCEEKNPCTADKEHITVRMTLGYSESRAWVFFSCWCTFLSPSHSAWFLCVIATEPLLQINFSNVFMLMIVYWNPSSLSSQYSHCVCAGESGHLTNVWQCFFQYMNLSASKCLSSVLIISHFCISGTSCSSPIQLGCFCTTVISSIDTNLLRLTFSENNMNNWIKEC